MACGAGPKPPTMTGLRVVIIEVPKIYTARLMKGDPNNIVTLALQVGRYIERYAGAFDDQATVIRVFPNEWKGQVPKDIHHPRIYNRLSTNEQYIVNLAGKKLGVKARGDMMDAVGLGQYAVQMNYFKGAQGELF